MTKVAFIFVMIFFFLIAIPCVGMGWLGVNLINRLGQFPSKTQAIQMSVMLKLIVIEIVSITLILMFFKSLVAE